MVPAPCFGKDTDRRETPVKENGRSGELPFKDSLKEWELFNLEMRRPVEIFKYTKDNAEQGKEREINRPASDAEGGCGASIKKGF